MRKNYPLSRDHFFRRRMISDPFMCTTCRRPLRRMPSGLTSPSRQYLFTVAVDLTSKNGAASAAVYQRLGSILPFWLSSPILLCSGWLDSITNVIIAPYTIRVNCYLHEFVCFHINPYLIPTSTSRSCTPPPPRSDCPNCSISGWRNCPVSAGACVHVWSGPDSRRSGTCGTATPTACARSGAMWPARGSGTRSMATMWNRRRPGGAPSATVESCRRSSAVFKPPGERRGNWQ